MFVAPVFITLVFITQVFITLVFITLVFITLVFITLVFITLVFTRQPDALPVLPLIIVPALIRSAPRTLAPFHFAALSENQLLAD